MDIETHLFSVARSQYLLNTYITTTFKGERKQDFELLIETPYLAHTIYSAYFDVAWPCYKGSKLCTLVPKASIYGRNKQLHPTVYCGV